MHITISEHDTITVLNLTGRMDATTVGTFEETCRTQIEAKCVKIIVNLEGLEYVSSAGLRGILTMQKASRAAQSTIVFCSMQTMVAEVFKISGFNAILAVYPSLSEAMNALNT